MRLWIHMTTTLIILMLCASSYGLPTGNPSNANGLKSSESASDSREKSSEDTATNSKTPIEEFLDYVPKSFKPHFVSEQGGKKVAFQPGITKCIKALKWLQEKCEFFIILLETGFALSVLFTIPHFSSINAVFYILLWSLSSIVM